MTIEELGSLGELVAAVATIITLAYLALQIRQNTITSRASTVQETARFSTSLAQSLYVDPELALLFDRGRQDLTQLSDAERSRFSYIMIAFMRLAQNLHYQFEQGLMDEDVWSGYRERVLQWVADPGAREWWSANRAVSCTVEARDVTVFCRIWSARYASVMMVATAAISSPRLPSSSIVIRAA